MESFNKELIEIVYNLQNSQKVSIMQTQFHANFPILTKKMSLEFEG